MEVKPQNLYIQWSMFCSKAQFKIGYIEYKQSTYTKKEKKTNKKEKDKKRFMMWMEAKSLKSQMLLRRLFEAGSCSYLGATKRHHGLSIEIQVLWETHTKSPLLRSPHTNTSVLWNSPYYYSSSSSLSLCLV